MRKVNIELPYNWLAEVEFECDYINSYWIRANMMELITNIINRERYIFENLDYSYSGRSNIINFTITKVYFYDISDSDYIIDVLDV